MAKVKVKVYSLISSLKTYHPTSHFTPWSLDLFIHVPSQLHGEHTVLQPFRYIEHIIHIAISILLGIHFHLCQVKHSRVKCLPQGHDIEAMSQYLEGRNMIFLWKSCTKRDSKPQRSNGLRRIIIIYIYNIFVSSGWASDCLASHACVTGSNPANCVGFSNKYPCFYLLNVTRWSR